MTQKNRYLDANISLLSCLGGAFLISNVAMSDDLPTRDEFLAAKPSFVVVDDQSVFDGLFADGNSFQFVVIETRENDEGAIATVQVNGSRFMMSHPAGEFTAKFKQVKDNRLRIYWRPSSFYTYHAACGMIGEERHCGLMDKKRMAWGFADPR